MAEFLTTHATAYYIEQIILKATKKLILISPFLQLSKAFFERLRDADQKGTPIVLIYGKKELEQGEEAQLKSLRNLTLLFCERLHAKCYYNEENMVITSMNMYEFSEKNNREMGILLNRQADKDAFDEAEREVQSIIRESTKNRANAVQLNTPRQSIDSTKTRYQSSSKSSTPSLGESLLDTLSTIFGVEKLDGYCIRCGDHIPKDTFHPLCDRCYILWAGFKNSEYPEKYCHYCGKRSKTTKNRPLCTSCLRSTYK